jgi:hypothetical protein
VPLLGEQDGQGGYRLVGIAAQGHPVCHHPAGLQGVWMVPAQDARLVREEVSERRQYACRQRATSTSMCSGPRTAVQSITSCASASGAPSASPAHARQWIPFNRANSTSGCVGPSSLVWCGSNCSNTMAAPAASPPWPRQSAMLCRQLKASGDSAPNTRAKSGSRAVNSSTVPAWSPQTPAQKAILYGDATCQGGRSRAVRTP